MEERGMTPIVSRHAATVRSALTPAPTGGPSGSNLPTVIVRGRALARRGFDSLRAIRFDRLPQVGRTSGLGLALLVASAVLWLSTVQPLARDAAQLETQVAGLDAAARAGVDGVGSSGAELDLLLARLPTPTELPGIVRWSSRRPTRRASSSAAASTS
jgi:type II secretory pathway component PulM